jgi:predicted TIM-barrel fold metal-dependent hydrolase
MNLDIVDTHQHLWDLSRHGHSWCAGIPALNKSFTMPDYLSATSGLRVTHSVHVEADVDEKDLEAETRWLLSQARDAGNPLSGLVIQALPERADFAAYLDRFADEPLIKGVRRVLHTQPDDRSLDARFRENVRTLAQRGLTFDLCVLAKQLPVCIELVRACPDVQFIVDHCGVPDVKGQALDPWREHLKLLAKEPNVIGCKVSGLVAYADATKDLATQIKPFLDHAVNCFGQNRIMFGSDWPVCLLSCPLKAWVAVLDQLTSNWSASDRVKLFSGNAKRIYRISRES